MARFRRAVLVVTMLCLMTAGGSASVTAPQSASVYKNSAENKYRKGDVEGAMADLTQAIALDPKDATLYTYRGFMRLQTGTLDGAMGDFTKAIGLDPKNAGNFAFRGQVKLRQQDLDGAIVDERHALELDTKVLLAYQTLGRIYVEKARDDSATDARKRQALADGIAAVDGGLALDPADVDCLVYKGIFLRVQAVLETDPAKQKLLIQQADTYRERASQIMAKGGVVGGIMPPPPAPPPPPPPPPAPANALPNIPEPKKTKHVEPVYPPIARSARIQGVVIIEATIGPDGKVKDAKILQSVALLDQAAIDAVRQWEYTPTMVAGKPVSVVTKVTVKFELR